MKIPASISKLYHSLLSHSFIRFACVGTIGFIVNYIMLAILYSGIHLQITLAQIIGAEVALLATFAGNNFWAFKLHQHISIRKKLITYHGTNWAAVLISSATVTVLVHFEGVYYGFALVIAALISMVWNYTFNKKIVFRHHVPPPGEELL